MYKGVKCRKCRKILFNESECNTFINAHNLDLSDKLPEELTCASIEDETLLFVDEDRLVDWLKVFVVKENWSKGRITCVHCFARIGSFDFVSGTKCGCGSNVLPAVHLIKSKIDLDYNIETVIQNLSSHLMLSKSNHHLYVKFKFCGDADCPDWVLAEINNLSKLSSVKLKLLAQVVAKGIIGDSINMDKAEKLFMESKLDATIDLKASIACITYIITSTMRYNCDHNAMHSELQQLGLPREHSTSLKRVIDEECEQITEKLKGASLKVNPMEEIAASVDHDCNCVNLEVKVGGSTRSVLMTPYTLDVLLDNLTSVRGTMAELRNTPYTLH